MRPSCVALTRIATRACVCIHIKINNHKMSAEKNTSGHSVINTYSNSPNILLFKICLMFGERERPLFWFERETTVWFERETTVWFERETTVWCERDHCLV